MKRRNFLKMMAAGSASVLMPSATFGKSLFPNENDSELFYHKLDRIKFSDVQLKYPRLVGKNSRLGVHGTVPKLTFCTLTTDKGANGLGLLRSGKEKAQELFAAISELEFHLSKCNQQI